MRLEGSRPQPHPDFRAIAVRDISPYDILRSCGIAPDALDSMKKLTLSEYQALAEFRYQIRRFLHFSERAVKTAGLERGQYQLMLAIKGIPSGVRPRIREVANGLQIQHHSAVELVNRLEARGYVRRDRAQDDRREVLLALTPKGEKVLAELALHHQGELRSAGPALVAALRRIMLAGPSRQIRNSTAAKSSKETSK